ncbi:bifunctional 2',3'-cyclic-nucleotide 2'-phosphodiesterase/3'-nucleotidase [Paenibacillus sp. XY044]|uniref:bifunctional 2',3'-cyclic-nucleotide 2'-phosphodiesterase/3'-nucleotidase n=1 Tax=Paenibacillus sp. XY044 TaxID=2026089 RepID=UPI000B9983AD|nr:bifunctional 2',3'-cyclic-nucleotide 2'-phosphodiesterase/3'-nucleotidase [Paenibacillus sp. XY044]OZB90877.1 2',3'-cyclic-nucleotide 2'-phosphodiesterase [Paenibacillus sp. XY044]
MNSVNGISPVKDRTVRLRIMSTTDVHACLMDYDYYRDQPDASIGLVRTAALIASARHEVPNTLLVDNGDLIQGTPLGTYAAKKYASIEHGQGQYVHPAIRVMNAMGYDAAALGNHEFNYGLDILDDVIAGADFPYVNANVYFDDGLGLEPEECRRNRYKPYVILDRRCLDDGGQAHDIRIGLIGFVPPQIMDWDQANLEGRVKVKDILLSALEWVPKMKEEGADLIVALAHTGFDGKVTLTDGNEENAVLPLSLVPGIDALTFSHTHHVFPVDLHLLDTSFKDETGELLPDINLDKGTIHGIPAVQAGFGGGHLGVIDLSLQFVQGRWQVVQGTSAVRRLEKEADVDGDARHRDAGIADLLRQDHEATVAYANEPIGTIHAPLHSYFSLVQDDASVQLVNHAQTWYARRIIAASMPELSHLPVLSVGSPFKAGRNGPKEYADIPAGPIAIKSATELYLYDNTIKGVRISGRLVKEWLEMTAGAYNRIDPLSSEEQPLLNPQFSVFNFDVISGITYEVDVTQPAKYKLDGNLNDPHTSRIVHLRYQGAPLDPDQEFIVISSNYRIFGGGNFPGIREAELVIDSEAESRQALIDYITACGEIPAEVEPGWRFVPMEGPLNVTFTTSPDAVKYAGDFPHIRFTGRMNDQGFGIFCLDLGPQSPERNAATRNPGKIGLKGSFH